MYYIGIDLGGTNIAAGIVDENRKIVVKGSVPTGAHRDADAIITDMANLCKKLLKDARLPIESIAYAGIAAPGSVNPETGIIEYSNNIPFHDYPICKKLGDLLGIGKVLLENDANAAAYGEALEGAAKGSKFSVMITLGTGVGSGIILDGKIYSGFNFAGAELGHTVIEKGGRPCSCGRRGCFETYSSATGLIKMTKEKMAKVKDSKMWDLCGGDIERAGGKTAFAAMKEGDKAGSEVVDEYIEYLACGLANVINIFQPNVLCIGGGVCNEKDNLLVPLLAKIQDQIFGIRPEEKSTKIRIAQLGNDAGIIGAAALGQYQN